MARILIVDDSRTSRRILRNVFEELHFEVCGEAKNGEEGYKMYKELKPDLVTMDITMPVMNGVEALKLIKSEFPEARVLMVSAAGQQKNVLDAIKNGASEFISKPFNVESIRQALISILLL